MKKADISEYFRKMGKKGGKARAVSIGPERCREIARKAGSQKGKKNAKAPTETQENRGESSRSSAA